MGRVLTAILAVLVLYLAAVNARLRDRVRVLERRPAPAAVAKKPAAAPPVVETADVPLPAPPPPAAEVDTPRAPAPRSERRHKILRTSNGGHELGLSEAQKTVIEELKKNGDAEAQVYRDLVRGIEERTERSIRNLLTPEQLAKVPAARVEWTMNVLAEAVTEDRPPSGYLGVAGEDGAAGGARLSQVLANTPAEASGLRSGDVVLESGPSPLACGRPPRARRWSCASSGTERPSSTSSRSAPGPARIRGRVRKDTLDVPAGRGTALALSFAERRRTLMRVAAAVLALSSLALSRVEGAAAQEPAPRPGESRIRRVTVYPDRALVVREAAVQAPAGASLFEVRDLPAGVMPDTVRARVVGPDGVRLRGLEVRTYKVEKVVGARARELTAARDVLLESLRAVDDRLAALASRREFVISVKAAAGHEASSTLLKEKVRIDDLKSAAAFVEDALLEIAVKSRQAEKEKRALDDQKHVIEAELGALTTGAPLTKRAVAVTLETPQAAAATLEISYIIVGAGWVPFYDIHATPDRGEATIRYYGQILQSTGEDWSRVEIALSTAHPARSTKMPEMPALAVTSKPSKGTSMAQTMDNGLQRNWQALDNIIRGQNDAVYNRHDLAALALSAETSSQISSHVFRIATPETVPADGSPHKVTIATTVFKSDASRVATPKLSPHLYLKTQVRNTNDFPYMPGDLNIFLGNDYIGCGTIELVAPNETFEVFLGVDEGIKVTRRLESRRTETGTLQKTHHVFVIRVENFKAKAAKLSVIDQLPVSRDSDVEIIPDPDMTKPTVASADGRLSWDLEIEAGATKEIRLGYRVYHPAGRPVFGLD